MADVHLRPPLPDPTFHSSANLKPPRRSKLGALELAAISLKATGTYLSRTLSYHGAQFDLVTVAVDGVFSTMYDRAT